MNKIKTILVITGLEGGFTGGRSDIWKRKGN
jgi:hypothetical protein